MNNIIGVTIGDIKGIGIEIFLKTLKDKKFSNFILFTNIDIINKYIKKKKLKYKTNIVNKNSKDLILFKDKINIFSYNAKDLEDNSFKSLRYAYNLCVKKVCIGLITLPLRKDLIKKKIYKNFSGHTEYFQKIDKKRYSNMILYHEKIIVSPLTTHIEVKKISKNISRKNFLYNQIYNLNKTLSIDFNIAKPKMIISGLNPHAGENGEIGLEEKKLLIPVINKLKTNGILVSGPYSADSILIKKNLKNYDCFIFMYHDQALIPFKFISQFTGVNYTGNLDIIRTSPDHGTAYDLVGSKKVSNKSFINCYRLIKRIAKHRLINGKS